MQKSFIFTQVNHLADIDLIYKLILFPFDFIMIHIIVKILKLT